MGIAFYIKVTFNGYIVVGSVSDRCGNYTVGNPSSNTSKFDEPKNSIGV